MLIMYVCVCKFRFNWIMNYHEYDQWTGKMDVKQQRQKLQIWACFGMTHVDTKFEQGLG